MLPDDITQTLVGADVSLSSGSLANSFNGDTGNNATFSNTAGYSSEAKGVVLQLKMPQVNGKITAITLGLSGTYSQTLTGSPSGTDQMLLYLHLPILQVFWLIMLYLMNCI